MGNLEGKMSSLGFFFVLLLASLKVYKELEISFLILDIEDLYRESSLVLNSNFMTITNMYLSSVENT